MLNLISLVWVFSFPPICQQDQKERAFLEQIEKIGGQVFRDKEGKIKGLLLLDRAAFSFTAKPRFTDEDIKKIDFQSCFSLSHIEIVSKSLSNTTLNHLEKVPKLTSLSLNYTPITDEGLSALLKKQKSIIFLHLYYTNITDQSLPAIANLADLKYLKLSKMNVTDKGLEELRTLNRLVSLSLSYCNISNAGLVHLQNFNNLRSLFLDRTGITDHGLVTLKELKKLANLSIVETGVTDDGILLLKDLPKLRWLDISSTKVTKKGKEALQKDLPWLEIIYK